MSGHITLVCSVGIFITGIVFMHLAVTTSESIVSMGACGLMALFFIVVGILLMREEVSFLTSEKKMTRKDLDEMSFMISGGISVAGLAALVSAAIAGQYIIAFAGGAMAYVGICWFDKESKLRKQNEYIRDTEQLVHEQKK